MKTYKRWSGLERIILLFLLLDGSVGFDWDGFHNCREGQMKGVRELPC